ncbi:hypothetical protein SAMN03097699_1521 [Flavobacteriaceae bacterium MAR_2010_188]|nr:hypothetical protein SAMN03097699_1521 [Flavobacteriaceae bacterium MAR_2010_188]
MKTLIVPFLLFLTIFACKNENVPNDENQLQVENIDEAREYPNSINKVLEAHGGLETWNKMKTLKFTIAHEEGSEITTTDLRNRYSLIETEKFTIGFDGNEAWIDQDSTYFKNDPNFYHNLMFYFYAMPFVLADEGIEYSEADSLKFEGKSYPGIKISYKDGVGSSSKDEYILYYDQNSHKMAWLGYTVTYFSKEKSTEYSYIKYDEWHTINSLLLPKNLKWFNVENDSIANMRNEMKFENVSLSEQESPNDMFGKPQD